MKSEKLYAAIGAADDELLIRCEAEVKKPKTAWIKYGSFVACAAVVLLFCVQAIPGLFNSPTPNNLVNFDPDNTALIGLPVEDFNLADLHNSSGFEADRLVFTKLSDFFAYNKTHFVFVRVIEAEQWTEKNRHGISGYKAELQTSTLHILSTLWSDRELPDTISVTQSKFGGCCADEETNLLRVGGVYMLPLSYWEEDDTWYINGDLDVLFEIDDQSRVWSHSQFEGFNQYDGKDAQELANDIISFTSDENFSAAITVFGRIVRDWGVLAEVTITFDRSSNQYRLIVDNILSVSSNPWYTWQPTVGIEINFIAYNGIEYLNDGGHYLMLLDPSEGGPYVEMSRVAVINTDGMITAIPVTDCDNVFSEYNGYTTAQMAEEAERAKEWHEQYAN